MCITIFIQFMNLTISFLRFCTFPCTESDINAFWSLNVFNATNSYLKVNCYCIGIGEEKLVTQPISERTIYQLALERNQHRPIKTEFRWVSHVCNWWTTEMHLHKWPIECHLVHLQMIRFLEVSFKFHKFNCLDSTDIRCASENLSLGLQSCCWFWANNSSCP